MNNKMDPARSVQAQSSETDLLCLLKDGRFHSGEELGMLLQISRSAVWKRVRKINAIFGLIIHSVPGRGYRLAQEMISYSADSRYEGAHFAWDITQLDTVDSTNAEALREIDAGRLAPFAIVSELQTAGRGRRGRSWVSPFGENIYFTLVVQLEHGFKQLEGLSLSMGLAVFETLKAAGLVNIGLKWPNDILASGKKIAGILIELVGDVADTCHAVIGIGINVNMIHAPACIDQHWTSINLELAKVVDRNVLLADLQVKIDSYLAAHFRYGFSGLRVDWESKSLWRGKSVVLTTGANATAGVLRGVDDSGGLLLEVDGEIRLFNGGEVSLRLGHDIRD